MLILLRGSAIDYHRASFRGPLTTTQPPPLLHRPLPISVTLHVSPRLSSTAVTSLRLSIHSLQRLSPLFHPLTHQRGVNLPPLPFPLLLP